MLVYFLMALPYIVMGVDREAGSAWVLSLIAGPIGALAAFC